MDWNIKDLFEAEKTFSKPPDWVRDGRFVKIVVPLDISGVTVEGLSFRGRATQGFSDENVMFQIEWLPSQHKRVIPLSRIEWRPYGSHNNHGFGPIALRFVPINGTHIHTFTDNYRAEHNDTGRDNLKVALPIVPDIHDLTSLLDFTGKEFRINDIVAIPLIPWQTELL